MKNLKNLRLVDKSFKLIRISHDSSYRRLIIKNYANHNRHVLKEYVKRKRFLVWFYALYQLIHRYLSLSSQARLLLITGLFRQSYYEKQIGKRLFCRWYAVRHYIIFGGRKISPHPLFETAWYLEMYPRLKDFAFTPVIHYLKHGFRGMYVPHPAFDVHYYCKQAWYKMNEEVSPLQHYLENAEKNLEINPNRYFDTRKYVKQNPDCFNGGKTPLEHWLEKDIEIMPLFDHSRDGFCKGRKKWNIILVSHEATRTGAPHVVLHLAEYFKKQMGFSCLIISERGGVLEDEYLKYADLVVLEQYWKSAFSGRTVADLFRSKIESLPDFVIVNSAESFRSLEAFYRLNVPVILLMHEYGMSYPDWYVRNIQKWSTHIIFPADSVRKSAEERLKVKIEQSSIMPQGYPTKLLNTERLKIWRSEVREELELKDDCLLFLGCGSIIARKGCDYFIDICRSFRDLNTGKPFKFLWIGDTVQSQDNCSYFRNLKQRIILYNLTSSVSFIDSRANIEKYFHASDVFLLTSRLDPFPYVVMHAMDASIPVICFKDTTGVSKLFEDGEAGFSVQKFNTKEAADKLALYAKDPKFREKSGEWAKVLLDQNFGYEHYVQHILNVGESLSRIGEL